MADATDQTTTDQVREEDADRPLDESELEAIQAAGNKRSEDRNHDSSHSDQVREQNSHDRRAARNNS